MSAKPIEHGTKNGCFTHYSRGEKPCQPCRDALNAYQRELRASGAAKASTLPAEMVERHGRELADLKATHRAEVIEWRKVESDRAKLPALREKLAKAQREAEELAAAVARAEGAGGAGGAGAAAPAAPVQVTSDVAPSATKKAPTVKCRLCHEEIEISAEEVASPQLREGVLAEHARLDCSRRPGRRAA